MFNFIRKLFKALNASGKAWQLSGAIVLAMFAGFLPISSLILLDILFVALIFNLNFGLFLLFFAFFSGVGYLFDPLFESLGYAILTYEGLNGLFTAFYNSALIRWSSFNYTLVTGSLAVSALLALPMFLVLNRVIRLYRTQIGQKLNEWKLTRWMKLFNEEATSMSVFRWWGLGVFGGMAVAIVLFMLLLFDPLAKTALEKSLSYTLQTEVSIGGFDSDLSDLSVRISGVEVADRDKLSHNLLAFETLEFDLGLSALMEKKAMIEHLNIAALTFDQQRAQAAKPYNDVEITKEKSAEEKPSTKDEASAFEIPDVDDILAKEELKSISEAQAFSADVKQTREKWQKVSDELKASKDIDEIQSDAKALQKRLKKADLKEIMAAKEEIDTLKQKISTLKSKYARLNEAFKADKQRLLAQAKQIKGLPQEDIKRLTAKYSLDAYGGANVIGTLFNTQISGYIKTLIKYYEVIKPYLAQGSESEVQEQTPPRGVGRWVHYENKSPIPALLIKEATVDMRLAEDSVLIQIQDISSDQKRYGKPMKAQADASGTKYKSLVAHLVDDRRTQISKSSFDLKLRGFEQEAVQLDALTMDKSLIDMDLKGQLLQAELDAKADVKIRKTSLSMSSEKNVEALLENIRGFDLNIGMKGDVYAPDISVKSDLDRQLSKALKSKATAEAKKFQDELKAGIMKKVAKEGDTDVDLGDIETLLADKQSMLSGINLDFSPTKSLKGLLPF